MFPQERLVLMTAAFPRPVWSRARGKRKGSALDPLRDAVPENPAKGDDPLWKPLLLPRFCNTFGRGSNWMQTQFDRIQAATTAAQNPGVSVLCFGDRFKPLPQRRRIGAFKRGSNWMQTQFDRIQAVTTTAQNRCVQARQQLPVGAADYFLALVSTTSSSRAAKASKLMAPRSPSERWRTETVWPSMSRSPTMSM